MCLNIGTPKNINFPFETNGKLMIVGVPILKHFRVILPALTLSRTKRLCKQIIPRQDCAPRQLTVCVLIPVGLTFNMRKSDGYDQTAQSGVNYFLFSYAVSRERVAQSVSRLTQELEVPGSIPGPATYFRFLFR